MNAAIHDQSAVLPAHNSPRLRVARAAWFVLAVITLGIFILSLPGYALLVSEDLRAGVQSPVILAFGVLAAISSILVALLSLALAWVVFRRAGQDRMAILVSFFLLAHGVTTAGPLEALEPFLSGAANLSVFVLQPALLTPLTIFLFAVFPDGRFVPSWSRWIVVLTVVLSLLFVIFSPIGPVENLSDAHRVLIGLSYPSLLAVGAAMMYAQIYRYRHVSTPVQRQQTKWVTYGIALWFLLGALSAGPWLTLQTMPPDSPLPGWAPVLSLIWVISTAIFPASLALAMLHYRLWDIDIIINRTLVYGALTAAIVSMYALVVGAFGALFQSSDNLLVSLLATGLAAILFQPLREGLQRGVNRLMYGERDDPYAVLSRLGRRLEASLSPDTTLATIVETVAQALKLPYVAIVLRSDDGRTTDDDSSSPVGRLSSPDDVFDVVAAYGLPVEEPIRLPLVYQSEAIGQLILAPRAPGESFTPAEQGLLENVAHQAGLAAHAVRLAGDLTQLAADLQRSRERLVTAREEERRRLRRDLHDGLGPVLAGLTLKLDAARNLLQRDPASTGKLLAELKTQTQTAIADIRRLVYDLRPPALDELGLVAAIREQAARCNLDGLSVSVETPEVLPPLPAAVEVAAYRIASEALTNVVRHAHARSCLIRLSFAALEAAHRTVEAEGKRKVVTILLADISGFTALSETLHSEQVTGILNACLQTMAATVVKHGGVVDKYIGDAILALFGALEAHEDDPERAIHAALAMQAALTETVSANLTLHIGINTGPVVAGAVGAAGQRDYTVMGEAVNLAWLLQDAAPSRHIYVGPETYRQTSHLFDFTPLAPVHIKGKRDPVQVYDVRARAATPGARRGIEGLRSPPIGRAAEHDALQLEVIDDGVGLPTAARGRAGVGLTSMRERAAELGGTCRVERVPSSGTRVVARLPLMAQD